MIGHIHRTSVNTHIQLKYNPVVWMAADRPQDIIKDGSNKVSSWTSADKKHTATQGTGSAQPTWVSGGFNGRDGILFASASAQAMDFGASDYFLPSAKTTDHTIILVFNTTYPASYAEVIGNWRAPGSAYFYGVRNINTYRFTDRADTAGAYASDRKVSVAFLSTSTNAYIYHNYAGQATTNTYTKGSALSPDLNGSQQWQLSRQGGAGEWMNGHICEVLVFDRALTIAQVTEILDYLRVKYKLQ